MPPVCRYYSPVCFCGIIYNLVNLVEVLLFTFAYHTKSFLKPLTHHQLLAPSCITIKSFATFYTKLSCNHHIHQQRTGSIFGVAKTIMQNIQNRETDIKADKICELQRSHGM